MKLWKVMKYMSMPRDRRSKRTVWRFVTAAASAEEAVEQVHLQNYGVDERVEMYRAEALEPGVVMACGIFTFAREDKIPLDNRVLVPTSVPEWFEGPEKEA